MSPWQRQQLLEDTLRLESVIGTFDGRLHVLRSHVEAHHQTRQIAGLSDFELEHYHHLVISCLTLEERLQERKNHANL